jgi:hypothetical protein
MNRMTPIRRTITRVHAVVLMLVSLSAMAVSVAGHFGGVGVYGFLRDNPIGYGGLYQAYLLMGIIAITLWLGASQANTLRWHIVGLLAHLPPLTGLLLLWSDFSAVAGTPVGIGSLAFHLLWIVVEAIAALVMITMPATAAASETSVVNS